MYGTKDALKVRTLGGCWMWRKCTECFHSNNDMVWRIDNDNDKDSYVFDFS